MYQGIQDVLFVGRISIADLVAYSRTFLVLIPWLEILMREPIELTVNTSLLETSRALNFLCDNFIPPCLYRFIFYSLIKQVAMIRCSS